MELILRKGLFIIFVSSVQRLVRCEIVRTDKIVTYLQIALSCTSFQIIEIHGMIGSGSESHGISVSVDFGVIPSEVMHDFGCDLLIAILRILLLVCRHDLLIYGGFMPVGSIFMILYHDRTCSKVDVKVLRIVDSAHVTNKYTVYIEPDIIVSDEAEDHFFIFSGRIKHNSVLRH